MQAEEISFQFANECTMESYSSPFGLSAMYIKITGTEIMGLGSTMGLLSGTSHALIYYNDKNDLINKKYRLHAFMDDEGMIRIDFMRIFNLNGDPVDTDSQPTPKSTTNSTDSAESPFVSTWVDANRGSYMSDPELEVASLDDCIPSIMLRAKCPEGHPDVVEPFIGIFSFEREE